MNTPAHGIELPRFRPTEEPFTVAGFVAEVKGLAAYLRERTTPRPSGAKMRAPASTEEEDPEFESGTRLTPAGRAAAERAERESVDEDTLVSGA